MDKKYRIWICPFLMIGLILILTNGCKKADNTPAEVTDLDGNIYKTVTIGLQVWMAENLKTTKYSDYSHTSIPNVTLDAAWAALNDPAYCWFSNDPANKNIYGAMYNWFTVKKGNLCPTDWHIPTDEEFKTLELYLGIPQADLGTWGWRGTDQGAQMKNKSGWATGQNGTNLSGFSALPGGYRYAVDGSFNDVGTLSYWWSATAVDSTTAWYRRLDGNQSGVYKAGVLYQGGKYIRCVKNN
jgi:uncharacterized protein (TIGR02145 family)